MFIRKRNFLIRKRNRILLFKKNSKHFIIGIKKIRKKAFFIKTTRKKKVNNNVNKTSCDGDEKKYKKT